MKRILPLALFWLAAASCPLATAAEPATAGSPAAAPATAPAAGPVRVAMVGLTHGHAEGFLRGGALAPAGGLLKRPDVSLVAVVEPDRKLFDAYAKRLQLPASLYYASVPEMVAATRPQAVLVCTATSEHRAVVEACAPLGVHVMMEKPLATKYADAVAIRRAAEAGKIHVLVNFETTWYASNAHAVRLAKAGDLGPVVKAVFRDGHGGPVKINVPPEFLDWLVDPVRGGDGALADFGRYGPSLMTWLMDGQAPKSVTTVASRLQPDVYPKVDDEAQIILAYPTAVGVVQASWNWPFSVKQMDVYGRAGHVKAIDAKAVEVRRPRGGDVDQAPPIEPPYDDPVHYLVAVLRGQVQPGNDPSSLRTNVIVTEILDAAEQSTRTGKTVALPLKP